MFLLKKIVIYAGLGPSHALHGVPGMFGWVVTEVGWRSD